MWKTVRAILVAVCMGLPVTYCGKIVLLTYFTKVLRRKHEKCGLRLDEF